jgi:hypothetical protein
MLKTALSIAFVVALSSCARQKWNTGGSIPPEVEKGWREAEAKLFFNNGVFRVINSFDDAFVTELVVKQIGDKRLVHCIRDEANVSGGFANHLAVETPAGVFEVVDNESLTKEGNRYSLAFVAPANEPLTRNQLGTIGWLKASLFAPIQCDAVTLNDIKKARTIEVVENAFSDHPSWIKLKFSDFAERVTPIGTSEDPIWARSGEVVLDPRNGYRIESRAFDISWELRGQITENVRKQRIEYLEGLDHFVVYSEWTGPASKGMIQRTEVVRLPDEPSPNEFTLMHYGISYQRRNQVNPAIILGIVGLFLVLISIACRRRLVGRPE